MISKQPKTLQRIVGQIISHSTPKTAVIKVSVVKVHPKYKKRYVVTVKYMAHDANDEYKVGDKVEFVAVKPFSHRKRFLITRKV